MPYIVAVCVACLASTVAAGIRPLPNLPDTFYSKKGDINLGMVIPIHKYDRDSFCGSEIRERGALQRVEAMAFAVNEINRKKDILPNITLGFIIMDDCSKDTTSLARALHLIQRKQHSNKTVTNQLRVLDVTAVLGSESSTNSVQLAGLLSLFKVPTLSYLSTSPLLSNKYRYSYFSRIVPSDTLQANLIVAILKYFQWTYVSIVYAEGSYGSEGYKAIRKRTEELGFCLAVQREMKQGFEDSDYDGIVDELLSKPRAKVVILFSALAQSIKFFSAAKRRKAYGKFIWIGSDGWGRNIQDYKDIEDIASGAITTKYRSRSVPRFDDYFQYLTPENASANPWFKEKVSSEMNCSFNASNSTMACSNTFNFASIGYHPEATVSQVIDAVYSYAYAIDNLTRSCSYAFNKSVNSCFTSEQLVRSLRNTSFTGENGVIKFEKNGDGISIYEIKNFYFNGTASSLRKVVSLSSFNETFQMFNLSHIAWNPALFNTSSNHTAPTSTCSDHCSTGFQAVITQPHCCWYCQRCRDNERTVIQNKLPKCQICPTSVNFTWPNTGRTECDVIALTYTSVHDFTGQVIVMFDCLSVVVWAAVTYLYVKNRHHRLIKATSLELSYIMLCGVFLSNVVIILFVIKPTDMSCTVTYIAFHLSFTMNYGPLTVKTNRVYRIFKSSKKSTKRPPMIGTTAQICFAVLVLMVQMLVVSVGIVLITPRAMSVMPNSNDKYVEVRCVVPQTGFMLALVCNLSLVVVCTFYAIKTRKLPGNYNESKFTSFSVYTTIILWLAFIPTYFTTRQTSTRSLLLSVAMLANSLVMLIFLFMPKLYAIYYVSTEAQHLLKGIMFPRQETTLTGQLVVPTLTNRIRPADSPANSSTLTNIITPADAPANSSTLTNSSPHQAN